MKRSFRVASASGIRFAFQSARAVSLNALWGAESAGFGANAASTKYVEINISLAQILDCPSSLVDIFDKDRTGKDKKKETRRKETLRKRFLHDAIYQMLVAPPLGVSIADQWEEDHQCLCDRVLQLRIDILQWHLLSDAADLQRSQLYFAISLARLESDTQLSHHYLSRIKQECRMWHSRIKLKKHENTWVFLKASCKTRDCRKALIKERICCQKGANWGHSKPAFTEQFNLHRKNTESGLRENRKTKSRWYVPVAETKIFRE